MKSLSTCVACFMICAAGLLSAQEGAEPEAQMAEMMKYAIPGDHHAHLSKLVGDWKANSKMWMAPGAPPVESTGTMKNTMILGGCFLQQEFSGSMMGNEFSGIGIDGYDILGKKHTGIWMDTMGTMMMSLEGTCSEDHKVTTMVSEFTDPMSGAPAKMKTVTTVKGPNELLFEMYIETPAGPFKNMEATYTRM